MILVNFSGGADSTLVLLDLLHSRPKDKVVVHHVIIKNRMNRWEAEGKAARKIVQKLNREGYKFDFVEVELNNFNNKIILDSLYTTQLAATYCFGHDGTDIYTGFNADDSIPLYDYQEVASAPFTKKGNPPTLHRPLLSTNKQEIVKRLKEEYPGYFELCFWCRTPQDGEQCGSCPACKLIEGTKD